MISLGLVLFLLPAAVLVAAYLLYPVLLLVARRLRSTPRTAAPQEEREWPHITICLPVYNEERAVGATIDRILAAEYPEDRRTVLVVSDASTDGTDAIVRSYADRGVRLIRLAERSGKTSAENEAGRNVDGDIVVNMDATIRVPPHALKALIRAFDDPTVGVASGRDMSVGDEAKEQNRDESTYVGYEMWVRQLETDCGSIVGASGCFYAIRRQLFDVIFPAALSRDFASPLIAREQGYRSVSVNDAVCYVARTRSLKAEYRRKVRTMTRGLETLWYKRALLNPFRYGGFALSLWGHKVLRWLVFPALIPGVIGLALLAVGSLWGRGLLVLAVLGLALGALGYYWPAGRKLPRLVALFGFVVSAHIAGVVAWVRALSGELNPVWEPTRRPQ